MSRSATFTEPDPVFEHTAALVAAREAGFAVWPTSGRQDLQRPDELSEADFASNGRLRIDTRNLIITETALLNESEQADALEALVLDQVFDSKDWPSLYLDQDFPVGKGESLRFDAVEVTRAGIMFGWAIEQAVRTGAQISKRATEAGPIEIVLDSPEAITPLEHLFIGLELRRRGLDSFDLALTWGGRWEPAADWIGDEDTFRASLAVHRAIAEQQSAWRMSFVHAEEKWSVLPIIHDQCRNAFHLNIDGLGWIEATRALARMEPDLLRKLLVVAQDRFPFDKPDLELATTEDDIRNLPDVPDSDLERVFVEDFRGRQLLRITASSLLNHEEFGQPLREAIERHQPLHAELVEAAARRHFAAWGSTVPA